MKEKLLNLINSMAEEDTRIPAILSLLNGQSEAGVGSTPYNDYVKISVLAKKVGVSPDTIRKYTKMGLGFIKNDGTPQMVSITAYNDFIQSRRND